MEKYKYRFNILIPNGKKKRQRGPRSSSSSALPTASGPFVKLILACSSAEERAEWISILKIIQSSQNQLRRQSSSLSAWSSIGLNDAQSK